jgi:protein disulfide-isomerase A6
LVFACALTLLPTFAAAAVVKLDEKTFKSSVVESNSIWIVGFYGPDDAASIKPAFDKAALALDDIVHIGSVDTAIHKSLAAEHGSKIGPMVKMFTAKESKELPYSGSLTADFLVDTALESVQQLALGRMGRAAPSRAKDSKEKKSSNYNENKNNKPRKKKKKAPAVVDLTDKTFDQNVFSGENDLYMVAFVAPWCGEYM